VLTTEGRPGDGQCVCRSDGHLRQARARKSKHAKEPQQGITQIEVPSPSVRQQGSREQYHRGIAAGEGLEVDDADVLDFWAPPPTNASADERSFHHIALPPSASPSQMLPRLHSTRINVIVYELCVNNISQ